MLTILKTLRAALTNSTTPLKHQEIMKELTISLRNENIHSLEAKSATKILNNIATYEDITLMTIADSDSNEFVNMIISSLRKQYVIFPT